MALKDFYTRDRLAGMNRAVISATVGGAGDATLVAAVAGKLIRVYGFYITSTAAAAVKFQSGTGGTDLTGAMRIGVDGQLSDGFCPVGLFETASGALLNLNISAAATITGYLLYEPV